MVKIESKKYIATFTPVDKEKNLWLLEVSARLKFTSSNPTVYLGKVDIKSPYDFTQYVENNLDRLDLFGLCGSENEEQYIERAKKLIQSLRPDYLIILHPCPKDSVFGVVNKCISAILKENILKPTEK